MELSVQDDLLQHGKHGCNHTPWLLFAGCFWGCDANTGRVAPLFSFEAELLHIAQEFGKLSTGKRVVSRITVVRDPVKDVGAVPIP